MSRRPSPEEVGRWAVSLATATAGRDPAGVLAGVATALDVPWDGPGDPIDVALVAAPGWLLLDAAREALLDVGARRRLGAHHTPGRLARRLVALALEGVGPSAVVADPACGGGVFLVAAAEHLVGEGADETTVIAAQLVGFDVDPLAVATTRAALRCWARERGADAVAERVVVGDGLAGDWTADAVIGNPPFLSPLGAATSGGTAAVAMRQHLGAPYVDAAGLFLLRSLERVPVDGRVVLIQPESVLSSRDAQPVRAEAAEHLEALWIAGEPVFGAAVRVCAPVLRRRRAPNSGSSVADSATLAPEKAEPTIVRRWVGAAVRSAGTIRFDPAAASWARLRPNAGPRVAPVRGATVGDLATATAGFRDQFYGLAAAATDGRTGHPLVTSGLIDPGRLAWGERPARIAGRSYDEPVVAIDELDDRLRAWVTARLVPKVLVATQTKVVEAAVDEHGRFIPMTPVLAVTPHDPADVWRIAAALTAPVVTAWALQEFGGAALSASALKLSAKEVLAAPLPGDAAAWSVAVDALRNGDVVACGTALAGGDDRLLAWWLDRLPRT